jgi:hypothetical protein
MEPQYMIAGHAAGVAAALAVKAKSAAREVDVATLQQELRRTKQILRLPR